MPPHYINTFADCISAVSVSRPSLAENNHPGMKIFIRQNNGIGTDKQTGKGMT